MTREFQNTSYFVKAHLLCGGRKNIQTKTLKAGGTEKHTDEETKKERRRTYRRRHYKTEVHIEGVPS